MFSFFKSKKHSPPASPDYDPIPGPDTQPSTADHDGFTVVNPSPQRNPYQQSSGGDNFVYPTLGLGGDATASSNRGSTNVTPDSPSATFHPMQGVPFKIAAELKDGDTTEVSRLQIDEILAYLTRTFELTGDYEFRLERAIIAQ